MRSIRMQSSPAETLEGWNLQFQTEVLFADNFCPICRQFGHLGKLSTNMASVLVYRVQHSLVSAGCKALFIFFAIKVKELSSKGKGTFREKYWSSHFWESATKTKKTNQLILWLTETQILPTSLFLFWRAKIICLQYQKTPWKDSQGP